MRDGAKNNGSKKGTKAPREMVERSGGNVFRDLGLPDAEELLAKAELAQRVVDVLAERKLTQAQAATLLGVDPLQVSALKRGRLAGFSTGRLLRFLNVLGRDVDIVIRPGRQGEDEGVTRVTTG
jgi:predicted XRE-type DNA-binding protein